MGCSASTENTKRKLESIDQASEQDEDLPPPGYGERRQSSAFSWQNNSTKDIEQFQTYGDVPKLRRRSSSFRWQVANYLADIVKKDFNINTETYMFETGNDRVLTTNRHRNEKLIKTFPAYTVVCITDIFRREDEPETKIYGKIDDIKETNHYNVTELFNINDKDVQLGEHITEKK